MQNNKVIKKLEKHLKKKFSQDSSGHDWYHLHRVRVLALRIARGEKAKNLFIIEMGALLHDIADWKFYKGNFNAGGKVAGKLLKSLGVDMTTIRKVTHIVDNVSFKGAGAKNGAKTLEAKIVQDADRLEALGAIGIARVMATGATFHRPIYDPKIKPLKNMTEAVYKNRINENTSINHFYEKLLLIKDRLNTKTAKRIAGPRHKFMEAYLKEFFKEWQGEK